MDLKGEYFTNMKLEGTPSFVRVDSVIDFDWGESPPQKGFKREEYSVRWTGKIAAPAAVKNVSIDAATDDGVRVFIDGKKVIDDWRDRSPETDNYVMDMEAGKTYDIRIEYYQNGGGASARLSWTAENVKHTEYFSNQIALFCRTPEMARCMSFKSQVADAIDYYFIYGPEPDQIVSGMRKITGAGTTLSEMGIRLIYESVRLEDAGKNSKCHRRLSGTENSARCRRAGCRLLASVPE